MDPKKNTGIKGVRIKREPNWPRQLCAASIHTDKTKHH